MSIAMYLKFVFFIWINFIPCEAYLFNLCAYLIPGATCASSCTHEATHTWGIPMCMHVGSTGPRCCIPENHPLLLAANSAPLTTTPAPTTPTTLDSAQCGRAASHTRVRRVVGGNQAPPGSWPWQVAIRVYTGQYVCGGVVIGNRWILSAAHCFQGLNSEPEHLRVYVGDQTLSYGKRGRHKYKPIRRIIQHENFQRNVETRVRDPNSGEETTIYRHLHDIALVELEQSLTFTSRLQPACLPDNSGPEISTADNCWVYGWGENNDDTVSTVDHLREVRGSMLTHEICSQKWGTNFTQDVVCFSSSGRGPCAGDSGGGLTCRHNDGRSFLMGIISWGRADCIHNDHPSIQMNVQSYLDWINTHLSAESQ